MENYTRLKEILNEIFELNKADLDFGIYRIMNQKRRQVNEFIEKQLPEDIKLALSQTQSKDKAQLEQELREMKKNLEGLGYVAEENEKYKSKFQQLKLAENTDVLEQEVFSHLANFFKRYYKDGDFISMRRYKKDVYAIPYEGEEVKLHWANHDQYYIKSSENFKNYTFKIPDGKKVTFQLREANTEQNNNKTQGDTDRKFAIFLDQPLEETAEELTINFIYEPFPKATKQDTLLSQALEILVSSIPLSYAGVFTLSPTEKNTKRTLLEKHLNDYVSKNSFDYFIHKDLGGFLSRELDFYIKNEVLFLDDINTKQTDFFVAQLSKIKAIKVVASKVIDFLAQIENFQKKLWLKKKFVIRTDYCITLDRIPAAYYSEIFDNKAQLSEWRTLYNVDIINPEQLTFEPFLLLDTQFFDEAFKDRLLAEFDDLDQQTDGLLINSENFQALSLLIEKYLNQVDFNYIDPPYNTDSAPILYKNDYRRSSWLTLMNDRLRTAKDFLRTSGVKSVAIDDSEMTYLSQLLDEIFFNYKQSKISVVHNPKGSITRDFNRTHEYSLFLTPEVGSNFIERTLVENDKPRKLRRWGENSLRTERRLSFYPIYIQNEKIVKVGIVPDDNFNPPSKNVIQEDGTIAIYPIDQDGVERRWNFGLDSIRENLDRIKVIEVDGQYDLFVTHELTVPKTVWSGGDFDARNYGNTLLINILGKKLFDFPKSINLVQNCISITTKSKKNALILDYFAGSGTTGHATIKLNREDGGKRKYILVEMGTYFNTVTKPRIQKVIYSDNWKNGKPQDKGGISQLVKYQVLESYEDTLNNLHLDTKTELDFSGKAQEEYLLQYMLELESREHLFNLEMFRKPFDYQLKVTENNELKPTKVDLVETFNYLIGLYVSKVQRVKDIKVIEGTTRTGITTLVIWRDLETTTHEEVEKLLRRFYDSQRTKSFQQIYINGDHHLENLRSEGDSFKIKGIEETFFKKMFNEIEL